ncbi:hypothetical protein OQH61_01015 [Helicobacter sp. MIT 21-1697]|uniref:hypothetical protein n=1 Tax=Helicobacter sp. MIT 21-1697 TaxID=2993733 RepID=UPI00224B1C1D|nr:hypothetical protein [Helicobacter sp. MIT 21-1697]MCX2716320.1 hypothetical protein [Helicobacter sp. MIT 21-1697]
MKKYFFLVLFCIFHTSLFATQCEESSCGYGHIGIGGQYYNFGGKDINSYAGYLALGGKQVFWQRLQIALGAHIGGGSTSAQNTSDLGITSKNTLFVLDSYVKLGVNIAGKNAPLFVNLVVGQDRHDGRIGKGNGLERRLTMLGGDIDGYLPLGNMSYLDYGAGYAWVGGEYNLNNVALDIKDYSYTINAYIGYSSHITQNTMWYVKLIGKYFDLKNASNDSSTLTYPASKDFVGMIEIGFKGFDK